MASVRARKETGKLYLDFRAVGMRFREQTDLADTPQNRRRLEAVARRLDASIRAGSFRYADVFPSSANVARFEAVVGSGAAAGVRPAASWGGAFGTFAVHWYKQNEVRWRRTTRALVWQQLQSHVLPRFGERRLDTITRADVLDFRTVLAAPRPEGAGLAPKTTNDVFGVLKAILDEASAQAGVPSPAARIKRLRVPRSDVEPFSLAECRLLLDNIRPDLRDYLLVRMFTGLRTGEVNGLRWRNVDLDRGLLLVRETFTHGAVDEAKTAGSWREVEMPRVVLDCLVTRAKRGGVGEDAYVFANAAGGPMDNHNFTKRIWYPLLRRLRLKPRRPYQLRHTAATLWLSAGENPTWIARQLGHTSLEMLYRTYARWTRDMTRRDGSQFDRLLDGGATGGQGDA